MNKKHNPKSKPYRPYLGEPYKIIFTMIADELNKTSMVEFDDLDVARLAGFELWKRVFPEKSFPKDADILRKRYHKDVNIVQSI